MPGGTSALKLKAVEGHNRRHGRRLQRYQSEMQAAEEPEGTITIRGACALPAASATTTSSPNVITDGSKLERRSGSAAAPRSARFRSKARSSCR